MLSPSQRGKLFAAAQAAYDVVKPSLEFDVWRKDEMERTVGVDSVKLVPSTGDAWIHLMVHFLTLAGDIKAAYELGLRLGTSQKRIVLTHLAQALLKNNLHQNYAPAILRRKYHVTLDDATDRQIWHVIYTINRDYRKRKLAESGNPF